MRKKKNRSYKFTDKTNPLLGIFSVIIAIFVIIMMIVICLESSAAAGQATIMVGLVGFFLLISALCGFILGVISLREKDIFYGFPFTGTILNSVLFVGLFIIYMIGLSL